MRGSGRVYRPTWTNKKGEKKKVATWWLEYSIGGKQYRDASGTTDKEEARRLLRKRIPDREAGKVVGNPTRVTLHQLREGLERHYKREGNKSLKRMLQGFNRLEKFWPEGTRALAISRSRVAEYVDARLKDGAAVATVRYELAVLNAAFSVAVEEDLLGVRPMFKLPSVQNARSGFFEEADFAALEIELSPWLLPLIQFLSLTGWRRDEGRLLKWDSVDWESQEVRLSGAQTKAGRPRSFPFAQAPELKQLLEAQWKQRAGDYVFHREGQPIGIGALRYGWNVACKRAGLPDALLHDLRRTAARSFRNAGVAENVIMEICGWETAAMFRRYAIVNAADRAAAVGQRFQQSPSKVASTPVDPSDSLGSTGIN